MLKSLEFVDKNSYQTPDLFWAYTVPFPEVFLEFKDHSTAYDCWSSNRIKLSNCKFALERTVKDVRNNGCIQVSYNAKMTNKDLAAELVTREEQEHEDDFESTDRWITEDTLGRETEGDSLSSSLELEEELVNPHSRGSEDSDDFFSSFFSERPVSLIDHVVSVIESSKNSEQETISAEGGELLIIADRKAKTPLPLLDMNVEVLERTAGLPS